MEKGREGVGSGWVKSSNDCFGVSANSKSSLKAEPNSEEGWDLRPSAYGSTESSSLTTDDGSSGSSDGGVELQIHDILKRN